MGAPSVLVVGESPSLGRAIADLLESEGIANRSVLDLRSEGSMGTLGQRHPVVVAASSGYYCDTGRRWLRGELPGVSLVVVGSRDPLLEGVPGVQRVELPLQPRALVGTVRALFDRPRASTHPDAPVGLPSRVSARPDWSNRLTD